MTFTERVPFALAIAGDKLLKKRWDTLSVPQRTILKAFYGLPLATEEEYEFWSISQGGAEYDDLGFVTRVTEIPYTPKEYDTLNLYVGRRSGKTDAVIGTGAAYEATLGGHKRFVRPGQEYKVPFIAQTKGDAEKNMNFIKLALLESDLLKHMLKPEDQQVATEIRFKDGLIIEPMPANKSVGRGHAIPFWIGDETAFWYTDPNAANPDFEVMRAISHAQAQFPDAKTFLGTTPWAEQGVAWKYHSAGTEGRKLRCDECRAKKNPFCLHFMDDREEFEGILSIHASTAAMKNPMITRKRLVQLFKRDKEAFPRESLAQTLKVVSGWLSPVNVDKAIIPNRTSISAQPGRIYVAAIDPAFRNDSFAFTIVHHDPKKGVVQDWIQYWEPQPGVPLVPTEVLAQIKAVLDAYRINNVYSDQYQLESLQQLALQQGFTISPFDLTASSKAKVTGSFKVLLDQGRLELLDNEVQKNQLLQLQKQVLQSGVIRIAAPPGKHDDVAMVLMLAVRMVVWMIAAAFTSQQNNKVDDPDVDHVKMGMATIKRRQEEARRQLEDD